MVGGGDLGLQAVEATGWKKCGSSDTERSGVVYPLRYHDARPFPSAVAKIRRPLAFGLRCKRCTGQCIDSRMLLARRELMVRNRDASCRRPRASLGIEAVPAAVLVLLL